MRKGDTGDTLSGILGMGFITQHETKKKPTKLAESFQGTRSRQWRASLCESFCLLLLCGYCPDKEGLTQVRKVLPRWGGQPSGLIVDWRSCPGEKAHPHIWYFMEGPVQMMKSTLILGNALRVLSRQGGLLSYFCLIIHCGCSLVHLS